MRSGRAIVFLAALVVVAYQLMRPRRTPAVPATATPVASARPAGAEAGVLYAALEKTALPAPARYGAELPQSLEALGDFDDTAYPPRAYVRDQLCAQDANMMARFERALAAAEREAPARKVAAAYGSLLRYCRRGNLCDAAATRLAADAGSPALRQVLATALADCERAEDRPTIDRADTPPEAVVAWYAPRRAAADAGFEPRLVQAVRELSQGDEPPDPSLAYAAAVLGASDDERTTQAMLELHAQAKSAEAREALAVGMFRLSAPAAVAVHRAACALEAHRRDPRCDEKATSGPKDPAAAPGAAPPLREQVRDISFDAAAFWASHPEQRDELVRTLRACASKKEVCLRHLAAVDRPAAREVALRLGEACGPELLEAQRALLRFEKADELATYLDGLGLKGAPRLALTARELLDLRGRVSVFDTETDQFPNEHDSLLRSLSALAGPALAGAVFEEVAAPDGQGEYTLHAYLDGQRYTAKAANLGDWYDVGAVLGLLNSLCRERASAVRFVALPTLDQTTAVLAGDEAGLTSLIADGLLLLAAPSDGMRNGKQFEDLVRQRLEGGGEKLVP
jgi:hypothetical protein